MAFRSIKKGAGRLWERNLNDNFTELFEALDMSGSPIASNTTLTPLGAGGTFIGEWSTDNNDQVGFSFQADQAGELFLDISRNGGATFATIKRYQLFAGEVGRFDALVKGAGRSFRLRFVNGPVAQGVLEVLAFTGSNLFPFAVSSRDDPRFVAYAANGVNATRYAVVVDLSDRTAFPHNDTGSIDLYATFLFVAKASNSAGVIQIGVITRIDGTSADISYVQGISFNAQSGREIVRDRIFRDPIRLGQTGGILTKVATLFKETTTAVNTGATLATPLGTCTPAVGDLIAKIGYTSGGAFDGAVSVQYAGNVSAT